MMKRSGDDCEMQRGLGFDVAEIGIWLIDFFFFTLLIMEKDQPNKIRRV